MSRRCEKDKKSGGTLRVLTQIWVSSLCEQAKIFHQKVTTGGSGHVFLGGMSGFGKAAQENELSQIAKSFGINWSRQTGLPQTHTVPSLIERRNRFL